MRLTRLFREFFDSEKAGGLILLFVTIISLTLANSPLRFHYVSFWNSDPIGQNLAHYINDGLMAIFFLLIGLELEREIYAGELSNLKKASMPIFAAVGGMVFPAGVYFMFNFGTDFLSGMGIPTATDIAFAIGILSLLGSRVPPSLKIFLTALAVIDDLGAIIIIAIFYTASLVMMNLFIALGIFGVLLILNRLKVHSLFPYIAGGVAMWYFMLNSGVHPTVTGVMLAFAIPFSGEGEKSPSYRLQHHLHLPVAFLVLPLFALANTAITIDPDWTSGLGEKFSMGIILGLVIGKPFGILIFSFLAVSIGLSALPFDLKWKYVIGAGFLGGIGFTMSIFITLLAFDNPDVINSAKIAILIGSALAGIIGFIWLKTALNVEVKNEIEL
jgi:Na+:H+ antiporter, NhaA family